VDFGLSCVSGGNTAVEVAIAVESVENPVGGAEIAVESK
jgi:hypothetical protein